MSADEVIVEETVSNADGTTTTKIVTRKKTEAQSGDFRIVTSGDTKMVIIVLIHLLVVHLTVFQLLNQVVVHHQIVHLSILPNLTNGMFNTD